MAKKKVKKRARGKGPQPVSVKLSVAQLRRLRGVLSASTSVTGCKTSTPISGDSGNWVCTGFQVVFNRL